MATNKGENRLSLTLPITTHYNVNNRNLTLFHESLRRGYDAIAYQYGKQFVETALIEIPRHGYFNAKRHHDEKVKSQLEAWQVMDVLDLMLSCKASSVDSNLDSSTLPENSGRNSSSLALDKLSEEQIVEQQTQVNNLKALVEKEISENHDVNQHKNEVIVDCLHLIKDGQSQEDKLSVEALNDRESSKDADTVWSEWVEIWHHNATDKLCMGLSFTDCFGTGNVSTEESPTVNKSNVKDFLSDYHLSSRENSSIEKNSVLKPENRESDQMNAVESNHSDKSGDLSIVEKIADQTTEAKDLDHNIYSVPLSTEPLFTESEEEKLPEASLSIQALSKYYFQDFQQLIDRKRIRIYNMNTYQGKNNKNGLNGCTVIAPLVAINHFLFNSKDLNCSTKPENESISIENDFILVSKDKHIPTISPKSSSNLSSMSASKSNTFISDSVLPDDIIEEVIDVQAPSILPVIRERLGLTNEALIIPSDVHDYLIDEKLLNQEQFIGVCGGSVLNENHVSEFIRLLKTTPKKSKSTNNTINDDEKDMEFEKNVTLVDKKQKKKKKMLSIFKKKKSNEAIPVNSTDKITNGTNSHTNSDHGTSTKIAATLFFHQHVIAVLKFRRPDGICWYDLVDSLPNQMESSSGNVQAFDEEREPDPNGLIKHTSDNNMSEEMGLILSSLSEKDLNYCYDNGMDQSAILAYAMSIQDAAIAGPDDVEDVPNAIRMRCYDEESLEVALRHYFCSKFTTKDMKYIDKYEWDEYNIELDPR